MTVVLLRKPPPLRLAIGVAWAILVILFFLWQGLTYRGVVALAAEWQFNAFGVYRPALTFLAFVTLLSPLPLLFRKRRAAASPSEIAVSGLSSAIASATRFLRWLTAGAVLCFAFAFVFLLQLLFLPRESDARQRLDANMSIAQPADGPTDLRGQILYNRTAALSQDLWFIKHHVRFAPIVQAGANDTVIRYLVELPSTDRGSTAPADIHHGILRKGALPGELLRLYRYAGFHIAPDHYVLFSSVAAMRWPYLVTAAQWSLAGVLVLICAGVQWLRRRRLIARRQNEESVS